MSSETFLSLSETLTSLLCHVGDTDGLVTPCPAASVVDLEFFGSVLAKALRDGKIVYAPLTDAILSCIVSPGKHHSVEEHLNMLNMSDPGFTSSLRWMMKNSIDGVIDTSFVDSHDCDCGVGISDVTCAHVAVEPRVKTLPLAPDGSSIPVTDDNKLEYIDAVCLCRLGITPGAIAIAKGFHEIVPHSRFLADFSPGSWRRIGPID